MPLTFGGGGAEGDETIAGDRTVAPLVEACPLGERDDGRDGDDNSVLMISSGESRTAESMSAFVNR